MTVPTPPEAESVKVPASTKDRSVNSSANNGETKLIRGIQEISREVAEGVYFRLSARQTRILEAAAIGTLISGLSAFVYTSAWIYDTFLRDKAVVHPVESRLSDRPPNSTRSLRYRGGAALILHAPQSSSKEIR